MKKNIIFIVFAFLLALIAVYSFRNSIAKKFVSIYLARQLESDVDMAKAHMNLDYSISIESLYINNDDGWTLQTDTGTLKLYPLFFLRGGLGLEFELYGLIYSYSNPKIIQRILEVLSVAGIDSLEFSSAKGELTHQAGRFSLKKLHLDGELLRIEAYGTTDSSLVNYDITLFLSRTLTSGIPEPIRKVFFKTDGDWAKAELTISGSKDKPLINFNTELFTLSVS